MIITRQQVIDEAYSWVGTPYRHLQRVKGPNGGCDCIQFLIGVGEEIGLLKKGEVKLKWYSPQWHVNKNEELLMQGVELVGLIEKPVHEQKPGDILGFEFCNTMSHLGIIVKPTIMVHALMQRPLSRVHEDRISPAWIKRIRKCYEVPGIE